ERRPRQFSVDAMHERNAKQRSGRGAQSFGIERASRALEKQYAGCPERLRGARDGPRVTGVLHAIEHHHQAPAAKKLLDRPGGRSHKGHHALARFGSRDTFKKSVRYDDYTHVSQPAYMRFYRRLHGARRQNHFHGAIAPQGLLEEMKRFRDAKTLLRQTAAPDRFTNVS